MVNNALDTTGLITECEPTDPCAPGPKDSASVFDDNPENTPQDLDSCSTDENFCNYTPVKKLLPREYEYRFNDISYDTKDSYSFNCTFKVKLTTEEAARKWAADYNNITQETMVFERNKKQMGKRVLRKLYLRCHHKQRQTNKHTKSNRILKTMHKEHNNKHTNCPAQMRLTILVPHSRHNGYLIEVNLNHHHNHLTTVADALRFRPLSTDVKQRYFDLFRQGHSPCSAQLEHESSLMYSENPHLLADRSGNPKIGRGIGWARSTIT